MKDTIYQYNVAHPKFKPNKCRKTTCRPVRRVIPSYIATSDYNLSFYLKCDYNTIYQLLLDGEHPIS